MRSRPSTVIASLAVAVTVLSAGVAQAAWVKTGSGSGATSSTSLTTPIVTATRSTSSPTSAIDVSWTATGQPAGTSFEVRRDGTPITCASNPCTDSPLASGQSYSYVVTAKLGQWTKASAASTASTASAAASATSYALTATPASITAGTTTSVTIAATSSNGNTDAAYAGPHDITWSGTILANSPSGAAPSPLQGATTSATFVNGVATVSVTLTRAGVGSLVATTGTLTGTTTVTVTPAAPTKVAMTSTTTTGSTGTNVPQACLFGCIVEGLGDSRSITTKVSVTDNYGNIVNDLAGPVSVTLTGSANTTLTPSTLDIPTAGPATSVGTVTLSPTNVNANNTSLTASRAPYASAVAQIKK